MANQVERRIARLERNMPSPPFTGTLEDFVKLPPEQMSAALDSFSSEMLLEIERTLVALQAAGQPGSATP
jgi:hypothetical protein